MARQTKRQRAASLRNLRKARSARRGRRKGSSRKGRSRKSRRARASRPRRARRSRRVSRRSTRRPGRRTRVRLRIHKGRYYQGRRGSLKGRTIRVNPPLLPTLGSVTGMLQTGAYGAAGFVGVNAVMMLVNRFGLLSWASGQGPMTQALIKTAVRAISVPFVAKLGGMVFKSPEARRAIVFGASFNTVYHGIKDVGGASGALPSWGSELLLGGGTGDFLTMGDFVDGFGADGLPMKSPGLAPLVSSEGAFA